MSKKLTINSRYSRRIWQEPTLTSGKAICIREVTPKGEEVAILLRHHDEEQKNKSPSKAFRRTVLWTLDQQAVSRVERIGRTVVNQAYEPRQLDSSWLHSILGDADFFVNDGNFQQRECSFCCLCRQQCFQSSFVLRGANRAGIFWNQRELKERLTFCRANRARNRSTARPAEATQTDERARTAPGTSTAAARDRNTRNTAPGA